MADPRVRVLRTVGAGGMGVVSLAERELLPGVVQRAVVKRPLPDEAPSARFLEEARALARVDHGNVVKLLDAGDDGGIFLLLEYVDGADADAVVAEARAGDALRPEEVAWIVHEAARGLAAAHGVRGPDGAPAPILHRDVSPQNLLVSRAGEVKVTDFGIAWAADRTSHTTTGTVVGNLRYISPEQLEGRVAGPATDVYGLGRVLEVLLEVTAPGAASDALAAIAARATRRAPGERYPAMLDLVDAVEAAVPSLCRGCAGLASRVGALADARAQVQGAFADLLANERGDDPAPEPPRVTARATPAPARIAAARSSVIPADARPPRARGMATAAWALLGAAVLAAGVGVAVRARPVAPRHPRPDALPRVVATPVTPMAPMAPMAVERVTAAAPPSVEASAAVPHAPVRETLAREPSRRGPRAPEPAPGVAPVPLLALAQPAVLQVSALPYADLSVDGGPFVDAPHGFTLSPGVHTLRARIPATGHVTMTEVTLGPGEHRTLGLQPE